jgi:hypothetical protein
MLAYKTKLCRYHQRGECWFRRERCHFAHGIRDLSPKRVVAIWRAKPKQQSHVADANNASKHDVTMRDETKAESTQMRGYMTSHTTDPAVNRS